jgi:hypothetical protein
MVGPAPIAGDRCCAATWRVRPRLGVARPAEAHPSVSQNAPRVDPNDVPPNAGSEARTRSSGDPTACARERFRASILGDRCRRPDPPFTALTWMSTSAIVEGAQNRDAERQHRTTASRTRGTIPIGMSASRAPETRVPDRVPGRSPHVQGLATGRRRRCDRWQLPSLGECEATQMLRISTVDASARRRDHGRSGTHDGVAARGCRMSLCS